MIEPQSCALSLRAQCQMLEVNRSNLYYTPADRREDSILMNKISEIWHSTPVYGYRRMCAQLNRDGHVVNHKRVQRLMKEAGIMAIYRKPKLSLGNPEHKIYPYLLRGMSIERPDQVWVTDLTYIKLPQGFAYLMAIMDVFSRKIMAWDVGNSMDLGFCVEILRTALEHGRPEIVNTDQGSQYTSPTWTQEVERAKAKVSMDGKGRWADNIPIERFWRTVKWEHLSLRSHDTVREVYRSVEEFMVFYNGKRLHQSLGYATPEEVYTGEKKAPRVILGVARSSKEGGIPLSLEEERDRVLQAA